MLCICNPDLVSGFHHAISYYMRVITFFKHLLKPSKKKIILLIVLLAVFFGIYQYIQAQNSSKEQIETVQVKRETIKETVSASGTMTGKNTANLRFLSAGKLAYINVKAGDKVTKGQLIAGLDTVELNINLQKAQNTLSAAQAAVQKTIDDIHLSQYGNGGQENIGSANETQTQRNLRVAAETARDSATDSVKAARQAFANAALYSPIDGVITQVTPVQGQNVTGADSIVQISDDSEKYFDAEVDEADIGKVSVGQTVEVTLNSYPDKIIYGTIDQILPNTKLTTSGATVIIARVKLTDESIHFIANINGQSTIITKEVQNALVIPSESITEDTFVYVKNGENYEKVEIKQGISSDTGVEVVSGLTENQEVVTTPSLVNK